MYFCYFKKVFFMEVIIIGCEYYNVLWFIWWFFLIVVFFLRVRDDDYGDFWDVRFFLFVWEGVGDEEFEVRLFWECCKMNKE